MLTIETHRCNLKPLNAWDLSLLYLLCFAILLPTAPQAICTGLVAIWFLSQKGWRAVFSNKNLKMPLEILQILGACIVISTLCHLVSGLMEYATSDHSLVAIVGKHGKLVGKQGVWGFFIVMSFQYAAMRGPVLTKLARPLAWFTFTLALYMLCQRYFGIDWVHGFEAKIPDNRYAFGVYRAAGFMSHPLTFGYTSSLLTILTLGIGISLYKHGKSGQYWYFSSGFSFLCLLLSNSRWPTILCVLGILYLLFTILRERVNWRILGGISLLVALISTFAVKDRAAEILFDERPIVEKVPRIVFWEVHWAMFLENPLGGVGYVSKEGATLDQYDKLGYNKVERKYSAHNIYLQTLADSGLVGLAGLLAILSGLLTISLRIRNKLHNPTLLIIAVMTILGGLMQNNLRDSEFLFSLWLVVGIASILDWDLKIAARSQIEDIQS